MHRASKLALGSVQFGLDYGISNSSGRTAESEVKDILEFGFSKGLNTIDTAAAYGQSEEVLGKYLSPKFEVVSKFIAPGGLIEFRDQWEKSLKKLKLNSLYGYLAHRPEDLVASPEIWKELGELKTSGVLKKRGYSVYSPKQVEELVNLGMIPDLIQVPFNILDKRFEAIGSKMHNLGVEIHVRSVFLQGLFFLNPDELDTFFQPIYPFLKEFQLRFKTINEKIGMLMNYVLDQPWVSKLVIGVNSKEQLEQNLNCLSLHTKSWNPPIIHDSVDQVINPANWPES